MTLETPSRLLFRLAAPSTMRRSGSRRCCPILTMKGFAACFAAFGGGPRPRQNPSTLVPEQTFSMARICRCAAVGPAARSD